jgi:hypothetical protein
MCVSQNQEPTLPNIAMFRESLLDIDCCFGRVQGGGSTRNAAFDAVEMVQACFMSFDYLKY